MKKEKEMKRKDTLELFCVQLNSYNFTQLYLLHLSKKIQCVLVPTMRYKFLNNTIILAERDWNVTQKKRNKNVLKK